jgi:hypothetical protein
LITRSVISSVWCESERGEVLAHLVLDGIVTVTVTVTVTITATVTPRIGRELGEGLSGRLILHAPFALSSSSCLINPII